MTLHKRGGAQSCLDYRHGVSSYCAGLNALAGSRCRLCLDGDTTPAPAPLPCNNHNAILERERIPNPSSWKTRRKAEARMQGSHYRCRLIACHQEKARAARRILDVTARHRPVDIASIQ